MAGPDANPGALRVDAGAAALRVDAGAAGLTVQVSALMLAVAAVMDRNPPPIFRLNDALFVADVMAELGRMSLADAINVSDVVQAIFDRATADVLTLTDVMIERGLMTRADAIALSDSIVAVAYTLNVAADTITSSDAVTYQGSVSVAEVMTVIDSVVRLGSMTFADSLTVSDQMAIALSTSAADAITVADSVALSALFFARAETLTLSDNLSFILQSLSSYYSRPGELMLGASQLGFARQVFTGNTTTNQSVADLMAMTDGLTIDKFGTDEKTRAETLTVNDAMVALGQRAIADTLTAADAHTKNFTRLTADTLTVADAVTRLGLRTIADTATIADSVSMLFLRTVADGITITDSVANAPVGGATPSVTATQTPRYSDNFSAANYTAGDLLVVIAANYTNGLSGVSGSVSGAFTKQAAGYLPGYAGAEIWTKVATGGSESITMSGANYLSSTLAIVKANTLIDKTGSDGGTSNTITASGANSQASAVAIAVFACAAADDDLAWGTPSGWTLIDKEIDSNNYMGYAAFYKIVSAVETTSITAIYDASHQTDTKCGALATFKPA